MAETLDLTSKEIPQAIDDALLRGHQVALGHVDEHGDPVVSFRGSTQVYGPTQLALWVRKRDSGFATAIKSHPRVHLVYYGGHEGPGPAFLSFKGSARVDESANDAVYDAMVEQERNQDPERKGVAVIVDVDSVQGFVPSEGMFEMERSA
jgi:general stress protein 26